MTHASQLRTRQSWKPDLTSNRKAEDNVALAFTPFIGFISSPTQSPQVGHSRSPQGLSYGRLTQPRGRAPPAPPRTISRRTEKGGGCGRLCRGHAVKRSSTLPSPAFPTKISPTPENCLQFRGSHSTPKQRSRSPQQGVPAKALELRAPRRLEDESVALDSHPGHGGLTHAPGETPPCTDHRRRASNLHTLIY